MSEDRLKQINKRIEDGSINEQSIYSYLIEKVSWNPELLLRTAIIDCTRKYTYKQMFAEWERYARVFSALDITEENASRVGIAGTISAEPLFAFYGLNMTGASVSMLSYPDFLPHGQWKTMVEKEKITDLILSDIMISPEMWPEIEAVKDEMGVRNIILLHSKLGGPCVGPAELTYNEVNYHRLKRTPGTVFMEDLLKSYPLNPIKYGTGNPDHLAIITHTSGTTKGTRKPLPYTEKSVNITSSNFGMGFHVMGGDTKSIEQYRLIPSFDFSSYLCMCGVVNSTFAAADCIVLTFFGFMHPKFVRAVDYYKINVLFTSGFMVDNWIRQPDLKNNAFSSLRIFSCGGSYLPVDKLKKYYKFLRKHGYYGNIARGYGMSETGGAQLSVPEGSMEDILGFPKPKENFRFKDVDDNKFYTVDDGVRTGVMYIASDSLCMNVLDGVELFKYTVIDGRNFLCSNDLVRVNENGSVSYAGRADRFFVNNDGVHFDAGIVEIAISKFKGVEMSAIVPVLDKRIHDTVPVLYIVPEKNCRNAAGMVRKALMHAFIEEDLIKKSVLPTQFILVDDIPCNANGKIDIYRITRERLKGDAYDIVPVRDGDKLIDIETKHDPKAISITAGTLPEGMEGRSAFNLYELFNG
ncbi:class I adenylate-forming enzyme family protein [Butyrivibrio sp. LC3010]|uniref:class I adenylate-forming enzyme family protein n=1 Tax=Butyrivibrio sp. LC3010 TaxID=1280680 RepID=UPI0004260B21|nr:class I adenylate-forming enzyme family protein [Butyrivibrio sp. LC3010]